MTGLGLLLIVAGIVIGLVFGLILLIKAFKVSILWGLGSLFVPFVGLFFVFTHWEETRKPFFLSLIAFPCLFLGLVIMPGGEVTFGSVDDSVAESGFQLELSDAESEALKSAVEQAFNNAAGEGFRTEGGAVPVATSARTPRSLDTESRFEGLSMWDLEEIVRDFPNDSGAFYELAARQAAFGKWTEAIKNLEHAFELNSQQQASDPDLPSLHEALLKDIRFKAMLGERTEFMRKIRESTGADAIYLAPGIEP